MHNCRDGLLATALAIFCPKSSERGFQEPHLRLPKRESQHRKLGRTVTNASITFESVGAAEGSVAHDRMPKWAFATILASKQVSSATNGSKRPGREIRTSERAERFIGRKRFENKVAYNATKIWATNASLHS